MRDIIEYLLLAYVNGIAAIVCFICCATYVCATRFYYGSRMRAYRRKRMLARHLLARDNPDY